MSARSRPPRSRAKSGGSPPPPAASRVDAGRTDDPSLTELRARLQEALDELEEQRAAGETLSKLLETAEQRVAQLESDEADQVRRAPGGDDAQRYLAELEQRRKERAALDERARSEEARRFASAERRLRSTEATLAQTLQALEEHRVAAVEQRMMADATEHHAEGLEQEMQRR